MQRSPTQAGVRSHALNWTPACVGERCIRVRLMAFGYKRRRRKKSRDPL